MKRCETLAAAPPGLTAFRDENPDEASWEAFRQGGQVRYEELADALEQRQRGICAFCEARLFTDIPTPARQVEHWRPKSNSGAPDPEITFGVGNLHASCLGGTKRHLPPPYGTHGMSGDNLSCGQKKGEVDPTGIVIEHRPYRPTELPTSPPLFTVGRDGGIEANPDAVAAGLPKTRIDATISFFGLDCPRLRVARAEVRAYLLGLLAEYEAEDLAAGAHDATRTALTRLAFNLRDDPNALLPAFLTTLRDFFGPANDATLLPLPGWEAG